MPTSHSPNQASRSAQRWWASSQPVVDAAHRLARAVERASYDPNQPRIPAGSSGGGRWTDDEGSGVRIPHADPIPKAPPIRLADGVEAPSPEFIADLKRQIDAADERLKNAILRGSSGIEISHAEIERARLAIAEKALDEVGSTAWAQDVEKENFPARANKCNLFVYDTLRSVESDPPLANGGVLYNWFGKGVPKYPVLAGQWADEKFQIPGWVVIDGPAQSGDVIARHTPLGWAPRSTGHVAISVGNLHGLPITVSARERNVVFEQWPVKANRSQYTVRRYSGGRLP